MVLVISAASHIGLNIYVYEDPHLIFRFFTYSNLLCSKP
jgi:hypothetical protein